MPRGPQRQNPPDGTPVPQQNAPETAATKPTGWHSRAAAECRGNRSKNISDLNKRSRRINPPASPLSGNNRLLLGNLLVAVLCVLAELFLDAEKLVVFSHTVGAAC